MRGHDLLTRKVAQNSPRSPSRIGMQMGFRFLNGNNRLRELIDIRL